MQHTDQAHRQAQENPETLTDANACSVQRSYSPVGCMESVGSEGLEPWESYVSMARPDWVKWVNTICPTAERMEELRQKGILNPTKAIDL